MKIFKKSILVDFHNESLEDSQRKFPEFFQMELLKNPRRNSWRFTEVSSRGTPSEFSQHTSGGLPEETFAGISKMIFKEIQQKE